MIMDCRQPGSYPETGLWEAMTRFRVDRRLLGTNVTRNVNFVWQMENLAFQIRSS